MKNRDEYEKKVKDKSEALIASAIILIRRAIENGETLEEIIEDILLTTSALSETEKKVVREHLIEIAEEASEQIGGADVDADEIVDTKWLTREDGRKTNFEDDFDSLKARIDAVIEEELESEDIDLLAGAMFTVGADAIIVTEDTRVINQSEISSFPNGYFVNIAVLDDQTCSECADMDGVEIPCDEMQIGVNCAPFHTSCRCEVEVYEGE